MGSDGFYSHALFPTADVLREKYQFLFEKDALLEGYIGGGISTGTALEKYFFLLISL